MLINTEQDCKKDNKKILDLYPKSFRNNQRSVSLEENNINKGLINLIHRQVNGHHEDLHQNKIGLHLLKN